MIQHPTPPSRPAPPYGRHHGAYRGGNLSGVHVRASDSDRERALSALREHTAAGRLSLDEFAERVAIVYSARTLQDLATTTADLPPHEPTADSRPLVIAFVVALIVVVLFAVLYSLAR
jgi:hypothetical protein